MMKNALQGVVLAWVVLTVSVRAEAPAPTGLMCNLLAEPARVGITDATPRFTWDVKGLEDAAGCLWATGKVTSDQSLAVVYGGKALESDHSYAWRVRTWDGGGRESGW